MEKHSDAEPPPKASNDIFAYTMHVSHMTHPKINRYYNYYYYIYIVLIKFSTFYETCTIYSALQVYLAQAILLLCVRVI